MDTILDVLFYFHLGKLNYKLNKWGGGSANNGLIIGDRKTYREEESSNKKIS